MCSWCPAVSVFYDLKWLYALTTIPKTSSCVPNISKIQILAPFRNPNICPTMSERWELRTRTLGCHVSTITLLACIVSILSTFVLIGLVAMGIKAITGMQALWKSKPDGWWKAWRIYHPQWWRGWRLRIVDVERPEQQRLLE